MTETATAEYEPLTDDDQMADGGSTQAQAKATDPTPAASAATAAAPAPKPVPIGDPDLTPAEATVVVTQASSETDRYETISINYTPAVKSDPGVEDEKETPMWTRVVIPVVIIGRYASQEPEGNCGDSRKRVKDRIRQGIKGVVTAYLQTFGESTPSYRPSEKPAKVAKEAKEPKAPKAPKESKAKTSKKDIIASQKAAADALAALGSDPLVATLETSDEFVPLGDE